MAGILSRKANFLLETFTARSAERGKGGVHEAMALLLPHTDRQSMAQLEYYERLTCDMRQQYNLPKMHRVAEVVSRKHVQIVRLSAQVESWEQQANERFGTPHLFLQYKGLIEQGIEEYVLPKLARHVGSSIRYWHFFEPYEHGMSLEAFTVKAFREPVFKLKGDHVSAEEERLAKIVSRKIRDEYGRGPNRLLLTKVSERYCVLEMEGLLGNFSVQYLKQHETLGRGLLDLLSALTHHVMQELYEEEWGSAIKSFTKIDYWQNRLVSLVVRQESEPVKVKTENNSFCQPSGSFQRSRPEGASF